MLTEKAKKALACPYCCTAVTEEKEAYFCPSCSVRYPIIDGVPHMLEKKELAARTTEREEWRDAAIRPDISYDLLVKLKSPDVHVWPRERRTVRRLLAGCPEDALIVDVGAGALDLPKSVVRLDLGPYPGIDIVGDGQSLPFQESTVDLLLIFRVLEHMRNPELGVGEIFRVLKPGGRVAAIVPFMEPFHINPIDISRFTRDGVRHLFRDFEEERCEWCVGPSAALAWMMKEWIATVFPGSRNKWVYASVRELAGWFLSPLRIVDYFLRKKPYAHKIAESFFYLGRKVKDEV
ncbi:MAG: methyltransferase domain-containing protein [Planctomycetota bacterium]|nr:MAG: methyltransferase domain-containing protein [Planctomycetota bacterium]